MEMGRGRVLCLKNIFLCYPTESAPRQAIERLQPLPLGASLPSPGLHRLLSQSRVPSRNGCVQPSFLLLESLKHKALSHSTMVGINQNVEGEISRG